MQVHSGSHEEGVHDHANHPAPGCSDCQRWNEDACKNTQNGQPHCTALMKLSVALVVVGICQAGLDQRRRMRKMCILPFSTAGLPQTSQALP